MEQVFSELNKSRYFLDALRPSWHMFLIRLMVNIMNQEKVKAMDATIIKKLNVNKLAVDLTSSLDGRICATTKQPTKEGEIHNLLSIHSIEKVF